MWFSLAINEEVMETSEYKDWSPDEEDEKGEFEFDELVKTELKGNRYLGRSIIVDTFMKLQDDGFTSIEDVLANKGMDLNY